MWEKIAQYPSDTLLKNKTSAQREVPVSSIQVTPYMYVLKIEIEKRQNRLLQAGFCRNGKPIRLLWQDCIFGWDKKNKILMLLWYES